ncbi:MAG: hypothetical protein ACI8PZ_000378 [Myxococcota bacterium]|jgi:hypothetical protein
MRYILGLALLAPGLAVAAPSLSVSGSCPGAINIDIAGLTPGANYSLMYGSGLGGDIVPYGPCTGTRTGLDGGRVGMVMSDADGSVSFSPTVPGGVCGMYIQVMDNSTCGLSSAEVVGDGGGPPGDVIYAADGSDGVGGFWAIDLATGTADMVSDGGGITGLAFGGDGVLYGIGSAAGINSGTIVSIDPASGTETFHTDTGLFGEVYIGMASTGSLVFGDYPNVAFEFDPVGGITPLPDTDGLCEACWGPALVSDGATDYYVGYGSFSSVDLSTGVQTSGPAYSGDVGYGYGRGGAATFHNGQLVTAWSLDAYSTGIYTLDPATGVATNTGIVIPSGSIDAIASPTP